MVGIKDVAALAGVSTTTVSHVLNGTRTVNPETARRVHAAVATSGYHPSAVARSLRRQQTYTIGIIVADVRNSFYTDIVRGIEDIAHRHDYSVILCNSDEDPAKQEHYLRVLSSKRVDGLIVVPTVHRSPVLEALLARGIPIVFLDRRPLTGGRLFVGIDNAAAAHLAVSHLIRLGHQRIAVVTGSSLVPTSHARVEGYRRALADHGLAADDRLLIHRLRSVEETRAIVRAFFTRDNPPSGLFITNNAGTQGTLLALRDLGLRMPQDIALVAFDDHQWAEVVDPPLTVVRQPTYDMGRHAVEMLLNQLHQPATDDRTDLLPVKLVIRGSCGAVAPRRSDGAQHEVDHSRSRRVVV